MAVTVSLLAGCALAAVDYSPDHPPTYVGRPVDLSIDVRSVVDKRDPGGSRFFLNALAWGYLDMPVADAVREAVGVELRRHGIQGDQAKSPTLVLECRAAEFGAVFVQGMRSSTVNLAVSVQFRWTDLATGKIVAENERAAAKSRSIGTTTPSVGCIRAPLIRGWGKELDNDLLVEVVAQELQSNDYLRRLTFRADDVDLDAIDKAALALRREFERSVRGAGETRRGTFAGFEDSDVGKTYEAVMTSSLMKHWPAPQYRYFARGLLDDVFLELALQRSDLFDANTRTRLGALQNVD